MNALLLTSVFFLTIARCLGRYDFSDKFWFGADTASFAIEGAARVSGKQENMFEFLLKYVPELFKTNPGGNVIEQANVTANSYYQYQQDINAAKEIGLTCYRFSISWPRLCPDGCRKNANSAGAKYYNNVINAVIAANLTPVVTLVHYDSPAGVDFFLGGFANEASVDTFTRYADLVFSLYADRVNHWVTFNAPYKYCKEIFGDLYGNSDFAFPRGRFEYLCGHNILKAHAKIYKLYHSKYEGDNEGSVTLTFILDWYEPATNSSKDIEAAKRAMDFHFGWFAHPLIHGNYPQRMIDTIAKISKEQNYTSSRLPEFTTAEIEEIKGTLDYVPLTPISTYLVSNNETIDCLPSASNDIQITRSYKAEWIDPNNFEVNTLWGFRKAVSYVWNNYNQPIISISSQGYGAFTDSLNDTFRITFLKDYLNQVLLLINEDGISIRCYSVWSLIDLFYFQYGYKATYGLVQVDYNDPKRPRVLKESAYYYKKVIETKKL